MESIHIADGNDEKKSRDAIPSIPSDALAVSFDNNIGHDYLQNYEERYQYYHRKEEKVSFDLEYLNKITSGGISNKTLTIALAVLVSGSLYSCAMLLAPCCSKGKTYSTLQWLSLIHISEPTRPY